MCGQPVPQPSSDPRPAAWSTDWPAVSPGPGHGQQGQSLGPLRLPGGGPLQGRPLHGEEAPLLLLLLPLLAPFPPLQLLPLLLPSEKQQEEGAEAVSPGTEPTSQRMNQ